MKNKTFIFIASFVFLLALGSFEQVLACTCSRESSLCAAFGNAKAVFVGKAVGAKQQYKSVSDGKETVYDTVEIYFEVEEAFSGVKKGSRVTVRSGAGGGDCGYIFEHGETYLIYGYGGNGGFSTSICTRTSEISKAEEDLNFLRRLPPEKSGAKIFGNVYEEVLSSGTKDGRDFNSLPGMSLTVTDTQNPKIEYKTETDSQGNYEITGIPTGKYKVIPAVPKNTLVDDYATEEFEITDRGCAEKNFNIQNDGWISGKVVDADGKPVERIRVELLTKELINDKRVETYDDFYTDEDGSFTFKTLAVGNYFLAVNYVSEPSEEYPFPTIFYPYSLKASEAAPIRIERGQKLTDVILRLPPRLVEKKIYGSVLWQDGSPVSETEIELYLEDAEYLESCVNDCVIQTDAQGKVVLTGYSGRSYRIKKRGGKIISADEKKPFPELINIKTDDELPGFKLILPKAEGTTNINE